LALVDRTSSAQIEILVKAENPCEIMTDKKENRMTFIEFKALRKQATFAEMERAGVTLSEQTQYGWLYPGGLVIQSTDGWDYEWMGMYYLLVEGREYFTDELEQLERILYDRGLDAGKIEGERQCALCRSIIPKGIVVVRADKAREGA
jgi:hypothetical protein